MKKPNIFLLYIYLIPAILSIILICNNNFLLGDFRSYGYDLSILDSFFVFFEFLIPLVIIYLVIKISNTASILAKKDSQFENFIVYIFIFIFFVTIFIGVIKVGPSSEITSPLFLLPKLTAKLNPYLLIGILAFSRIKTKHFIFCLCVCILYSYKQTSLQGYLIVFFSYAIFLLRTCKVNIYLFILLLLLPLVLYEYIFDILKLLYSVRNKMRGFEFNEQDIVSLSIGRISSLSSYLYIQDSLYNNIGNLNKISDYFSLGIFSERIFSIPLFDTISPSNVFNAYEIGDADYSIFLGLNGFLYILFQQSAPIIIINTIVILLVFILILQMLPYFSISERIPLFFLVMYSPILSFDIWEISILFQSLILLNILFFFYRKILLSTFRKNNI
ncbi:oligosaccharide repeat unit polymerase [Morganella morganii]|uniref:oligosaccharide repeat unit polymerase n=1 Tax=Morganella morganii TaxID=582 RepID=UPI00301D07C3